MNIQKLVAGRMVKWQAGDTQLCGLVNEIYLERVLITEDNSQKLVPVVQIVVDDLMFDIVGTEEALEALKMEIVE